AAESAGTLGTVLHRLFQRSFAVAKEVRSTTRVGANSVSMATAAVKLAARIFPSLKDQNVLLIGAGEMVELCATHFAAQGPARLTVANRTLERAARLAHRFNGRSIELKSLAEHLHEHDIVVSSTASSLPILGKGLVERALQLRQRGEDAALVLESLSQALTNKLMHGPTQPLNDAAGDERRALADLLARLFRIK